MGWFQSLFGEKPDERDTMVKEIAEEVARQMEARQRRDLSALRQLEEVSQRVTQLKEQLETLRIEKARKEEDHDRREREIQHKLGLHREQVEQESKFAKQEAELEVRKQNLAQEQENFQKQLQFQKNFLEQNAKDMKDVLRAVLRRLPELSADLTGLFGGKPSSEE